MYAKYLGIDKCDAGKWDLRFLAVAKHIAQWSKDPSTKTGAVIVRPDKTVCSVGYNGFPMKMRDEAGWYDDRDEKYERIIHCEMNAILNAKEPLKGYTLYTWPFLSCSRCAVHVIQSGIVRAVAPSPSEDILSRWADARARAVEYLTRCGVEVLEISGLADQ